MKIEIIEQIIKNKSHYFIASTKAEHCVLFSTPPAVLRILPSGRINDNTKEYEIPDDVITLDIIKQINNSEIHGNIFLSNKEYSPFQCGITISRLTEIYSLPQAEKNGAITEFVKQCLNIETKGLRLYDFFKLYNKVFDQYK